MPLVRTRRNFTCPEDASWLSLPGPDVPHPTRRARTALEALGSIGRARSKDAPGTAPPAWEPEGHLNSRRWDGIPNAPERSEGDENAIREQIHDAIERIESISGGLTGKTATVSGAQRTSREGAGGGTSGGTGDGPVMGAREAALEPRPDRRRKTLQSKALEESSIAGLHGSLKMSLELATAGERHASASTEAMADMSEWLLSLERKQMVRHARDLIIRAYDGTASGRRQQHDGLSFAREARQSTRTRQAVGRTPMLYDHTSLFNGVHLILFRLASVWTRPPRNAPRSWRRAWIMCSPGATPELPVPTSPASVKPEFGAPRFGEGSVASVSHMDT